MSGGGGNNPFAPTGRVPVQGFFEPRPGAGGTMPVAQGTPQPPPTALPPVMAHAYAPVSIAPQAVPHKKKHHKHKHKGHKKAAGGGVRSDINVTPLVDVVLVLLIIFMVVTPMLHRGVDLELPETKNHSKRQDTGEQLVVSVRHDGVYIEADRVELDKLGSILEKELKAGPRPVNVHADRALRFGEVRKALEQVHTSGAATVNLETKEYK